MVHECSNLFEDSPLPDNLDYRTNLISKLLMHVKSFSVCCDLRRRAMLTSRDDVTQLTPLMCVRPSHMLVT